MLVLAWARKIDCAGTEIEVDLDAGAMRVEAAALALGLKAHFKVCWVHSQLLALVG